MFEHYLAALLGPRQMQDLAHSALPDARVRELDAWEAKYGWLYR